jgi:hypothetical protein
MASLNDTENHNIPIQTESRFQEGETPEGHVTGEINAPMNSENRPIVESVSNQQD